MLALSAWESFGRLSLSFKMIWAGIICSALLCLTASRLAGVERRWKLLYRWLFLDCAIICLYFALLVFGTITHEDFVDLLKWFIPALAFSIGGAPLLHILEARAIERVRQERT